MPHGKTWCHSTPRWPPSCLHLKRTNIHRTALHQHRAKMLSCVFAVNQFHIYVFDHAFTLKSYHTPPEQITLKNLADAPVHLQKIMLYLQNYYVTINYHPGKEMLVADALSCYIPPDAPEIPHDITINHVYITPQEKSSRQLSMMTHSCAPLQTQSA